MYVFFIGVFSPKLEYGRNQLYFLFLNFAQKNYVIQVTFVW